MNLGSVGISRPYLAYLLVGSAKSIHGVFFSRDELGNSGAPVIPLPLSRHNEQNR